MRKIYILVTLLLCLIFPPISEAQILDQKISVEYKNQTIEYLLKDLEKKYKLQFSYSNTLIPVKQKVTLIIKNQSLRQVLDEVFKNSDIEYEEIGTHIVLKKSVFKQPAKSKSNSTFIREEQQVKEKDETKKEKEEEKKQETAFVADTTIYFPEEEYKTLSLSDSLDEISLRKKYLSDRRRLKQQYYRKLDSINLAQGTNSSSKSRLKSEFRRIMGDIKTRVSEFKANIDLRKDNSPDSSSNISKAAEGPSFEPKDSLSNKDKDSLRIKEIPKPVADTGKYLYRPAQASIITPIGTNGVESPKVVNGASFNLIGGQAAGLEGAEFAGLVNIERDHVWGVQFAGLGNMVKNDVRGIQFSGLVNINGGNTQGVQFAGLMNIVSDNAFSVQGAGLINLVSENCKGTQLAGFSNITGGKVQGTQLAGFLNVGGNESEGAQVAGFMNVVGTDMEGIQIAGFMNVAADTLEGVQLAGFLNAGKVVKGSQVGFINVADTLTGVQVGFFSYSRRGYRRVELWGSETLYGNIAFKTGTSHLHNIYAAGVRIEGNDIYWAYGLGLGSEFSLSKRLLLNLELLSFHLHKNGYTYDELNLLNQFKLNLGVLLAKKASIFAGPVFNVMVSNHYNAETNTYGSQLTPGYAFYNKTAEKMNVAMWVGFNAGIRF